MVISNLSFTATNWCRNGNSAIVIIIFESDKPGRVRTSGRMYVRKALDRFPLKMENLRCSVSDARLIFSPGAWLQ